MIMMISVFVIAASKNGIFVLIIKAIYLGPNLVSQVLGIVPASRLQFIHLNTGSTKSCKFNHEPSPSVCGWKAWG